MSDVLDVANKIADDVNAVMQTIVGNTYNSPRAVDAAAFGPFVVPAILVFPGTVTLREVMLRLEAGRAQIGIEFDESPGNTHQYLLQDGMDLNPGTAAIAVTVAGSSCTISGTIQAGDVIGCQAGRNGAGYAIVITDTLTSVAAGLAAAMNTAGTACTVIGATITLTTPFPPAAYNVGTSWVRTQEYWRRRQFFFATLWAPDVYSRQYIGRYLETVYAPGARLTMPDGTFATVLGCDSVGFNSVDLDEQQLDLTYVRKVRWYVDFITTSTSTVTQVVAQTEGVTFQPLSPAASIAPPLANQL